MSYVVCRMVSRAQSSGDRLAVLSPDRPFNIPSVLLLLLLLLFVVWLHYVHDYDYDYDYDDDDDDDYYYYYHILLHSTSIVNMMYSS